MSGASVPNDTTAHPTPWTPWKLALAWLLPKLVILVLWLTFATGVQGDVFYYYRSLVDMATKGATGTLVEYPTPVVWLLQIPRLFAFGYPTIYVYAFAACMMALDAALTVALWRYWSREGHSRHPWPVLFWVAFTFLISPTAYLRFDMLPAVLAGGALLLLAGRRPAWAGALVGLGAATKLWPALLWLALLGRKENRLRASAGFWGTGAGLALASLVWAGWGRLVSPLTWQKDRGLQVESIWATVPMLTKTWDDRYTSYISKYQAFEVFGPSVGGWLAVANVLTVVGMLALLALIAWWLVSRHNHSLVLAGLVMVLASAVMIITNKTFSPQYLLWVGGPMAAVMALADAATTKPGDRPARMEDRGAAWLAWWLLAVTLLTNIVYPIGYHHLVRGSGVLQVLVTLALVARNVAFLVFTTCLAGVVVRRVRGR